MCEVLPLRMSDKQAKLAITCCRIGFVMFRARSALGRHEMAAGHQLSDDFTSL
jgi:hypothetical protein